VVDRKSFSPLTGFSSSVQGSFCGTGWLFRYCCCWNGVQSFEVGPPTVMQTGFATHIIIVMHSSSCSVRPDLSCRNTATVELMLASTFRFCLIETQQNRYHGKQKRKHLRLQTVQNAALSGPPSTKAMNYIDSDSKTHSDCVDQLSVQKQRSSHNKSQALAPVEFLKI